MKCTPILFHPVCLCKLYIYIHTHTYPSFIIHSSIDGHPAIPLLSIYLKKTKTLIPKDMCTPMFIAPYLQ